MAHTGVLALLGKLSTSYFHWEERPPPEAPLGEGQTKRMPLELLLGKVEARCYAASSNGEMSVSYSGSGDEGPLK